MIDYVSRLTAINERIALAAERAGRSAGDVRLLLASKQQTADAVQAVARLTGCKLLLGESRVQEFAAKAPGFAGLNADVHFIGQLQRNKINQLLAVEPRVACIQTVDSLKLAESLSKRYESCAEGPKGLESQDLSTGEDPATRSAPAGFVEPLQVMVQVNVSGEVSKAGIEPEQAVELALAVATLPNLTLAGFMTIGLNSREEAPVRAGYAKLRELRDTVAQEIPSATELSMGMSGDLEWAIAEGATMVRVGSAVFGSR